MKCWSVVLNQNFSCLFFKIRKNMNEEVSFKNGTWKKRWSIKMKEEVIHKRARYEQKGHSQNLGAWRKGVIHKTVCEPGDTKRGDSQSMNEEDLEARTKRADSKNSATWTKRLFTNLATRKGVTHKTVCNERFSEPGNMMKRGGLQNCLQRERVG